MPAVTKQAVIGPVGGKGAHGHHGDVVYQEHDHREDGQTQEAVGDDSVDLVGGGERSGGLFPVAGFDHRGDVDIALVGDDGFGVVVHFPFGSLDVLLDMSERLWGDVPLAEDLVVPLEDLYGVPALPFLRQVMDRRLLDMSQGVLHAAGEGVHGDGLSVLRGVNGGFRRLHHAGPLQRRDLDDPAAQLVGQLGSVDPVAVLLHHVHHVDGYDHRDAQLGQLGGEIEVALQVGAVDDVQYGVGAFAHQVVPCDHLLQGVGRQGIDARQVGDDHAAVLLELAFLFLHGDARPVAHEMVGAGQGVEQGRFAAVRIARKGDSQIHHISSLSKLVVTNLRLQKSLCYAISIIAASALRSDSS